MKGLDMKVKTKGTWRQVANSARTTVGKAAGTGEVSLAWRHKILLAEHSPIRQLIFKWTWKKIPYWVSVHFVRHWLGILHWVRSSRTDRTGIDRTKLPQDNPVTHECEANAQALINISRKRLCNQASLETRLAWTEVVESIATVDPVMAEMMVPECIYRGGHCPEITCCGWIKTPEAQQRLKDYWRDRL
jgi:hypothetical protein